MAKPTVIPMTDTIVVGDSYTIRITALDPNSGATVAAVKVDGWAFLARNLLQAGEADQVPPSPVSGAYTTA